MSDQNKPKKRFLQGWRKPSFALLLIVVYALGGFFLLPWLLQSQAEKRLPELLKRPVFIDQVRFNPFTLRLQVDGFVVQSRQNRTPLLKIDSLIADCAGFLSLSNRALVLEKINIQGPYLKIVKNEDASYNFSDLLPASSVSNENSEAKGQGVRFSLNNIKIAGGIVEFTDQSRDIFHWLNDITIGLPQISNLPHLVETQVQPSLALVVNGSPLVVVGQTKPFAKTLETRFHINIDGLDLPYYLSYMPSGRNFTVADGSLTTRLDLVYLQPENEAPRLTLSGTAVLNDLLIRGQGEKKDHRFVFLPELSATFGPGNLLEGELFLSEIVCRKPEVNLLFKPDGIFYLPKLIAAAAENSAQAKSGPEVKAEAEEAANFTFKLDRLRLEKGVVNLRDERVTPLFSASMAPVEIDLENFSTERDHLTRYALKLQSDAGEILIGNGDFSVDPVNIKTRFALDNLPLPRYVAYYQDYFAGQLDGRLRFAGELLFSQSAQGEIGLQLQELECGLADLKINSPDGKLVFDLPQLDLAQSQIDVSKQECVIGSLEGQKGSLTLIRRADNVINLVDLLPPSPEKKSSQKDGATDTAKANEPWHLFLNKGRLRDFQVTFKDLVPAAKAEIKVDQINLAIDELGSGKGESGTCRLDLRLAERGRLLLNGPLSLVPPQVEFDVDLQQVPLKSFQPYLGEHLDLVLVKGEAATKGHLSLRQEAALGTDISFSGKAAVENLKTVDGRRAADVVGLRSLTLDGISFSNQPSAFSLQKLAAKGLQVNFVKESDGRSNFEMMLRKDGAVPEDPMPLPEDDSVEALGEASTDPSAMALEFKKIELSESTLTFIDRSMSPSFKMALSGLEGEVEGLSSLGKKPAEVKLSGQLNGQAPVSVSGFVDPLAEDIYIDLKIDGQGIGMTALTPYSGKFVGYTIGKGKLFLDLNYQVEKQKLKANNAIFLDQFDFGSSVESPDALSLPLKLAVALLRDRQGEIHLNLPVSGELGDPEFSLGGIIIKVFINLITKAITSPFALIGSLAGGGEELNLVTFAAGQVELDEIAHNRLEKLAKVLYDRPGLKVEIAGRADTISDRQALHEDHFKKLLQAQKFKKEVGRKKDLQSPDEVVIEADEFERYLWQAYKAAPFAKEKNLVRMVKKIEPAEQERLLREFVKVSDDELTLLARNRAHQVMEYISEKGPVESQRLFLVDPQLVEDDPAAAEKGRQVEMKIK